MALKMARDDRQAVMQVGSYKTADFVNLSDGGIIAASDYDAVYRIVSVDAAVWITIDGTPALDTGLLLQAGSELTLLVRKGNSLGVAGGTINVVPLGE